MRGDFKASAKRNEAILKLKGPRTDTIKQYKICGEKEN